MCMQHTEQALLKHLCPHDDPKSHLDQLFSVFYGAMHTATILGVHCDIKCLKLSFPCSHISTAK